MDAVGDLTLESVSDAVSVMQMQVLSVRIVQAVRTSDGVGQDVTLGMRGPAESLAPGAQALV